MSHRLDPFQRARLLALAWCLVGLSIDLSADGTKEADPDAVAITLRATGEAGGRQVRLGDVADITGGTRSLRERLAALDLDEVGAEPVVVVKRRQVEYRLKLAGVPEALYRLAGEAECRAVPVRRAVSADAVVQAAKAAALKRLPWPAEDIAIQLMQPITPNLPTVADSNDVTIRAEPHTSVNPGRVQMDVSIYVRGEKKTALPVYLDVKLVQKVLVARYALNRSEVLTEQNTLVDRRAVDAGIKAGAPESLLGKPVRRLVEPGTVLSVLDIEEATGRGGSVVRARQPVKISTQIGNLSVTVTGEAEQDGKVGDVIKVKNADSGKVVLGRVTGPGTVAIEQPAPAGR